MKCVYHLMKSFFMIAIVLFGLLDITSVQNTQAQATAPSIDCGAKIQNELTVNGGSGLQLYTLSATAGTTINVSAEPIGNSLSIVLHIYDAANNDVQQVSDYTGGHVEQLSDYVISSSKTKLGIEGYESVGAYTLSVGCTLPDGTVIKPGDKPVNAPTAAPVFSGNGFPGLPSKDFNNGVTTTFNLAGQNTGNISPTFDGVFGYTFDGKAGQVFDLNFTRTSGNLNLGLAVLSADNRIVFQASLVTSSDLSTHFTLPSDGTYTIGVWKIDLLPPDSPQTTAFQITGTLSSS